MSSDGRARFQPVAELLARAASSSQLEAARRLVVWRAASPPELARPHSPLPEEVAARVDERHAALAEVVQQFAVEPPRQLGLFD